MGAAEKCELCEPYKPSDRGRYVWEDRHWRLWTRTAGPIPGYSFLTTKRHIPYIADLDGPEASSFGGVLARLSAAIRDSTGAELVHVHVFGDGVAHFHVHLVPHDRGDALNLKVIRDDVSVEEPPMTELIEVAERIAAAARRTSSPPGA
jgi:diadenosine tetraphosphate (Ap4A) HIT family hydrolase